MVWTAIFGISSTAALKRVYVACLCCAEEKQELQEVSTMLYGSRVSKLLVFNLILLLLLRGDRSDWFTYFVVPGLCELTLILVKGAFHRCQKAVLVSR